MYRLTNLILLQWLASCLLGSLFPDVDTKSKIQKLFYTGMLMLFVMLTMHGNIKAFIAASFIGLLPLLVNHRGIFHKPLFVCAIALTTSTLIASYMPDLSFIAYSNAGFFLVGALSHIWLDMGLKRMMRF